MNSQEPTAALLAAIIENADRIEAYIGDMSSSAFAADRMLRDAVERCLARLCEAADQLGPRAAGLAPEQPWDVVAALGLRLRGAHERLGVDEVWSVAIDLLPGFRTAVSRALRASGNDG
ncbi:MAG TPA: HepT-like ribonuclease domain-containing protein [Caulobacteraceae bacterium]|jgi:uncharacterized protein with HEPN domain|nr:HepT-like ribonuclease domain-containing protein [Caulobacteraceae bacterium]